MVMADFTRPAYGGSKRGQEGSSQDQIGQPKLCSRATRTPAPRAQVTIAPALGNFEAGLVDTTSPR